MRRIAQGAWVHFVCASEAVEHVSGNGGMMTRTKTKQTTKGRMQPSPAANVAGMALMSTLADNQLKNRGKKVVDTLLRSAVGGSAVCAQLLVHLAEREPGATEAEPEQNGRSQALAWAAEEKWVGESSEDAAEMDGGCREPED